MPNPDTRPDAPAPRCPRCGYDLAGVVATWTDTCPVGGLCSECGLAFQWADVLCADRQRVSWLYEHAPHWWCAGRALRTFWMLVLPWRFWRGVRMHHCMNHARAFAWSPLCAIVVSAIGLVVGGGVLALPALNPTRFTWLGWSYGGATTGYETAWSALEGAFGWMVPTDAMNTADAAVSRVSELLHALIVVLLGFVSVACTMVLVCPSEWRRARVRTAHLGRIMAYSFTPLVFFACASVGFFIVDSAARVALLRTTAVNPTLNSIGSSWLGASPVTPLADYVFWTGFSRALFDRTDDLALLLLVGPLIWLMAYWWFALRRGLELRRVWALWLICVVSGLLGAAALPLVLFGP